MNQPNKTLPLWQVLLCGAAIVTLSMGVRHGFGLWLQPITQAQNWTRENFAFAMAIQNLTWGFFSIFSGMVADKFGAFRVIVVCALLYALGLVGMAYSPTPMLFTLTAGMFLMVPVEGFLISNYGWQEALVWLTLALLVAVPLALGLREPSFAGGNTAVRDQSIFQALREAFAYRSFQLLMAGFFVCGFQVVFIAVHMPSFLKDKGLSPEVASISLALIGLFNVFGTYIAGSLGQRLAKRKILAFIYLSRSVAITLFMLAPLTPWSVYIFASVMGLLWLSTVPPTNAVIAQIFGIAHFSMLGGFVFFS
ncbi:MAG: MFS transporter, partial [Betaproteobacteria bacterium]|nr:MFS transporter [Betaproteobacteria bacterium]